MRNLTRLAALALTFATFGCQSQALTTAAPKAQQAARAPGYRLQATQVVEKPTAWAPLTTTTDELWHLGCNVSTQQCVASEVYYTTTVTNGGAVVDGYVVNWSNQDKSNRTIDNNSNESYLGHSDLTGTNLSNVNWDSGGAVATLFTNANLSNVNLSYGIVGGSYFVGANLTGLSLAYADASSHTYGDTTYRTNFSGCDMRTVNLTSANLTGAILRQANLANNASFGSATTSNADLTGANLSGCDLSRIHNSNLTGATITGCDMTKFDFATNVSPLRDTAAPIFTGITTNNRTRTAATIVWNTNEPARGIVEWGSSPTMGNALAVSSYATSQAVRVSGLLGARTYWYRVRSIDPSGNTTVSNTLTFMTPMF